MVRPTQKAEGTISEDQPHSENIVLAFCHMGLLFRHIVRFFPYSLEFYPKLL